MHSNYRKFAKPLMLLHLFVCCVWLIVIKSQQEPPVWMIHVILLSTLGVQFTWGMTVGLAVGPGRKVRSNLWWSLLLIFMPLYPAGILLRVMFEAWGFLTASLYLAIFTAILAAETYSGVLLGVKMHSESAEE